MFAILLEASEDSLRQGPHLGFDFGERPGPYTLCIVERSYEIGEQLTIVLLLLAELVAHGHEDLVVLGLRELELLLKLDGFAPELHIFNLPEL
jgi:hypothetical protein